MRILYLSQYFPPEAGATQTRAFEMGRNLVKMGHSVTMLCEFPNHPSGIIPPAYRGKLFERASLEGMEVIRVWVKASPVKSFRNRMLFYLSFMFSAIAAGLALSRGRYDVIYATSPPLFVGGAALALSRLKRTPFVFEVRDLWPESAIALGEISNPWAISMARRLEKASYRRAAAIVVVTRGIQDSLLNSRIPAGKVALIPNGANTDLFRFSPEGRLQVRQELGIGDKFLAIYAGIHGLAQGLEVIVEAARSLEQQDIHFLLVGDGPKKAEIAALAEGYALANLTLLAEKPRQLIPAYLSAADVALIPLRKLDLFKGALPSKIFDAWACERPVLLSVDGEAREIMERAGGGVFVEPEDAAQLVKGLLFLKENPEERKRMGANGRRYTVEHFSREKFAGQLAHLLEELI
jgi:glycosyltransferase involved in cell wall biosynthesis